MQIEKISDTYHRITFSDGSQLFLVGTAHVSSSSVDQVRAAIEEENPDTICIELDSGRLQSKQSSWQNQDIRKVFKEKKGFLLLANTALASFQKRLGAQTGISPGDELLGAVSLAKEKGMPISLCDRDIQTTFRRAWAKSGLWNKCKLLATLISTAFSDEKISEEDLEELKKQETLENMLNEMAKELPSIKEVLIDERDIYLATKMFTAPGRKKVGVIGAGHTKGILSALEKLDSGEKLKTTEELCEIPESGHLGTVLSFMMAVTTLSLPSLVMLRKAIKPRLLWTFVAVCTMGIIIVGYAFNALQSLFIM